MVNAISLEDVTSTAIIRRVADSLLGLPYTTWGFGDSVAFEAMIEASDAFGDESWARFAHGWGRAWATRATPFVDLDCTAPGAALVHLATRFDDGILLQACVALADYLMKRPTLGGVFETWQRSPLIQPYGPAQLTAREAFLAENPPPGVFLDCLHFDPPFLVALGIAVADERYVTCGIDQALGYVRLLQGDDGLFEHFVLDGEPGRFGPGWGRGQGWALLGLLDVIEALEGHASEVASAALPVLRQAAAAHVAAMVALQRPDGHWFAVVNDPASGDETSTAGFMAYGFRRALRLGVASGADVRTAAESARRAIRGSLDADGLLADVSAAVWACTEPSHYAHVPRGFVVPWGQGPALLALLTEEVADDGS